MSKFTHHLVFFPVKHTTTVCIFLDESYSTQPLFSKPFWCLSKSNSVTIRGPNQNVGDSLQDNDDDHTCMTTAFQPLVELVISNTVEKLDID